ncbi:collagen alpha-1(XII) chain-like [Gigantopelta aegis]|uniref:collagen alpha-1(XII) chain-like n=1 Tax=Gigantopelta aegis TaxID=1735272 RepID=UPI001B88927B|nr:collagen alpha-1(XII) chain-like [Gigantopelta aegis]
MRDFLHDFLSIANIDSGDVRVGLVTYSTNTSIQFHLKTFSSKVMVLKAIEKTPYTYGSTNTADGIRTMRKMFRAKFGDRKNVNNVAVVITDGVSNIEHAKTIPEARKSRRRGIHIYSIGIGLTDLREIEGIASRPVIANRFIVKDFSELRALRDKVFRSVCVATEAKAKAKKHKPACPVRRRTIRCLSSVNCKKRGGWIISRYVCRKANRGCCKSWR